MSKFVKMIFLISTCTSSSYSMITKTLRLASLNGKIKLMQYCQIKQHLSTAQRELFHQKLKVLKNELTCINDHIEKNRFFNYTSLAKFNLIKQDLEKEILKIELELSKE